MNTKTNELKRLAKLLTYSMINIYSCKDYEVHAKAQTLEEANTILKGTPFHEGWAMFAMENANIIGNDTDGITGHHPEMLPFHERCGSVLTGREQE